MAALLTVLVVTTSEQVGAVPGPSPIGVQRVLLIPVAFPVCPNNATTCVPNAGSQLDPWCPVGEGFPTYQSCPWNDTDQNSMPTNPIRYTAPRHTAAEWASILTQRVGNYWAFTSYFRTPTVFYALQNPLRTDGWFDAPAPVQALLSQFSVGSNGKAAAREIVKSAIDVYCLWQYGPFRLNDCAIELDAYNRVAILSNWKGFGGKTYGRNEVYEFDTTTLGKRYWTASYTNEETTDAEAASTLAHELGHQYGLGDNYGECSPYIVGTRDPSINDCVNPYDIMGLTDRRDPLLTSFTRYELGYLGQQDVAYRPLIGSYNEVFDLRPLSFAPAPGQWSALEFDLTFPLRDLFSKFGYNVECRRRVGGDEGLNGAQGIPKEGVLVTSIHEYSQWLAKDKAPPVHVAQILDVINATYTDPIWGFQVRFDGFVDRVDPSGAVEQGLCRVSVAVNSNLPPGTPPRRGSRIRPGGSTGGGSPNGSSPDLGLNAPLQSAHADPLSPFVPDPLWPGHANVAPVRVLRESNAPLPAGSVGVRVDQPARVGKRCEDDLGTTEYSLPAEATEPVANHVFTPTGGESVSILGETEGDSIPSMAIGTAFAHQFHQPIPGAAPPAQTSTLRLINDGCDHPVAYRLSAWNVPPGWNVTLTPNEAIVDPGQETVVEVTVQVSPDAPSGEFDIPITVTAEEFDLACAPVQCESGHPEQLPAFHVFARVVGAPASVTLSCPVVDAGVGEPLDADIVVSAPGGNVVVEAQPPTGAALAVIAVPTATGFHAAFNPNVEGVWQLFARWGGDATHAPAESGTCTITVHGDADGDAVGDAGDNCTQVANADQRDTDGDRIGNACDPDYDGNGTVGLSDFNQLRSAFGARAGDSRYRADLDADGDGAIGLREFNLLRSRFGSAPGPSAFQRVQVAGRGGS